MDLTDSRNEFEFPTNIKQIGSITDGLRIYVEDYVCTYLQQYAESAGYEERLGILVGRTLVIDGQTVLFISGAVQGLYAEQEKDMPVFTDKTWSYAKEQIRSHFKGLEIVGWVFSQPGYGLRLHTSQAAYHKQNFPLTYNVLFLMDPEERANAFYVWDEANENIRETRGYFIYYDKNRGMHEYMLENKVSKLKIQPAIPVKKSEAMRYADRRSGPELVPVPENTAESPLHIQNYEKSAEDHSRRSEPMGKRHMAERSRRASGEQKRIVNMLVSLSAVLFIICFIMGAGLIQNDGRITSMEKQITQLNTAYRDLLLQTLDENAAAVFAPQNDNTADNTQTDETQDTPTVIQEDGSALLFDGLLADSTGDETEAVEAGQPENLPPEQAQSDPSETEMETVQDDIPEYYVVQEGDTLLYISMKFYGTSGMVNEIMALNDMDNPDKIFFGRVLSLPRKV